MLSLIHILQSVETKEESYTERLKKLDSQIQKTREQDTDSNVYSAKTSAETELKMWDGELNAVYNALLEALSQEEALKLANEEKDWLKKRESDACLLYTSTCRIYVCRCFFRGIVFKVHEGCY